MPKSVDIDWANVLLFVIYVMTAAVVYTESKVFL